MILYLIFSVLLVAVLWLLLLPLWKNSDIPFAVRKRAVGMIGAVFSIGLFGMYSILGAPEIIPLLNKHNAEMAALQQTIAEASDAIKASPRDLAAWIRLGQSFMGAGQYKSAASAFKQAVILSKGNPLILLAYSSAMISDAGGKITDDAKKSLEMVLLQQPQNPEARYLLTVRMLQDGNNEEAMKNMKELYRSLPDNSPMKDMINRQIGRK